MNSVTKTCDWEEKLANLVSSTASHSEEKSATQNEDKKIIKLPAGEKLTVVIVCPRNKVPEGVQIKMTSGGNFNSGQNPQEIESQTRFNNVSVDLKSLIPRISIDTVNVVATNETSCIVYINATICTPANGDVDNDSWINNPSYGPFIKIMLNWCFKTVVMKPSQRGGFILHLRGRSRNEKVFFTN